MITPSHVQELVTFDGGEELVLSAYLNLTPDRQIRRTYRAAFADLVKQLEPQLDEPARAALEREAARVRAYLESELPHGKGLALFSCTPRGFWQAIALPVVVAESVHLGRRPYVRPLLDVLDEYERYAVALVDKEKARLFTVYLGKIEEHDQVYDVVPGKHDQGGWSQANYQRHHEAHVYWHLKRVAAELSVLLRRRPFDRLVLAGPEEATSELQRLLPRSLRRRLVATFPAELFASQQEILERTLEIERGIEREAEERLVRELFETAAAGGPATHGVAATLEAIWLGCVHKLVVADELRLPGSECPECGRLAQDCPPTCPACGVRPMPLADVVERAIERTVEEAGTVEIVHGAPASRLKAEGEGLGALLRFSRGAPHV
jgi:peptide subunit release factor 1 (eRF1)